MQQLTPAQVTTAKIALLENETINYSLVGEPATNYKITKTATGYIYTIIELRVFN